MDEPEPLAIDGCLEEAFKGNVRIRVHELTTCVGTKTYLVELAGWDAPNGRYKIIFATGGIKRDTAITLFTELRTYLRGFDWQADEFVVETEFDRN